MANCNFLILNDFLIRNILVIVYIFDACVFLRSHIRHHHCAVLWSCRHFSVFYGSQIFKNW